MVFRRLSEIVELLKDWAAWYNSEESGYPGSTPIWRLRNSPGESGFQSSIPSGVLPPPGLGRVQKAMNHLLESRMGQDVEITRMFYTLGLDETVKRSGLSRRNVYEKKRRGEAALEGFLLRD